MKQIIIDGYNVIHELPELSAKLSDSLSAARSALAMHVMTWKVKHAGYKLLIVFDGQDQLALIPSQFKLHGIDCHFTKTKQNADNYILTLVRKARNPKDIIVVSDDNYVGNNCRVYHSDVRPTSFLRISPKGAAARLSRDTEKAIPDGKSNEITRWYERQLSEGK